MHEAKQPFPSLGTVYKGCFPFRLSVPSFIYPASYADNVRLLGPFVDEIELLLFESSHGSLPDPTEIDELAALARRFHLTYNVHLPIDLDLGAADPTARRASVRRMAQVARRAQPLAPTTYTLHLPFTQDRSLANLEQWRRCILQSMETFLQTADIAPGLFSIETLDYPPQWFAPIVNVLDLSVCLDVGHVLHYGFDLEEQFTRFGKRIVICHLHGVAAGRDHESLDRLAPEICHFLSTRLRDFEGSLSIEVFNFERLRTSLPSLINMISGTNTNGPIARNAKGDR
jgi:sugar phosphate isomerase/epimerase